MTSLGQRAAHATWWSLLEIASRYGAQFAVTVVLARLLTPEDFGLIAMLIVFTSLGATLVDAGFGTALIQRKHVTGDDEATVFVFAFLSGVVVGTVIWLAAPFIAHLYHQPRLVQLTHLVAWVLPLGGLGAVPDALLTKQLKFRKRATAEILASTASGVIAVVLAWRGFGVWSIAWQVVVAATLRMALLWLFSAWRPMGRFTMPAFRKLFGFGGYMLSARLLDTLSNRAQLLLLGWLFNASTLGYYTLAQNAQQAPADLMGAVLNRVGLPVFSEISNQPDKLRNALRFTLRTSLFLFLPGMAGLALLAKPIIQMVYGARWESAAPILALLALASALWPFHVLNLAALTSQGRSDRFLRLEVVKKVVLLVLVVAASPFGPIAVACAVLASSLLSAIVNTHYSRHMLDYGLRAQMFDQRLTLLLCALSAVTGWVILHWTRLTTGHTLAAIAAAAVIYLGGAWLFRSRALGELLEVARALIRSRHAQDMGTGS